MDDDVRIQALSAPKQEHIVSGWLKDLPVEDRHAHIRSFVQAAVTEAIGDEVDNDQELMEAGLDSLAFVDLRNKIVEEVRTKSTKLHKVKVTHQCNCTLEAYNYLYPKRFHHSYVHLMSQQLVRKLRYNRETKGAKVLCARIWECVFPFIDLYIYIHIHIQDHVYNVTSE